VEYGRCLLNAPWAVAFPAQRAARFHFVARGGCWLRTKTMDWMRLNPGDAVLLPRGNFHALASAPDAPVVDIDSLARVGTEFSPVWRTWLQPASSAHGSSARAATRRAGSRQCAVRRSARC